MFDTLCGLHVLDGRADYVIPPAEEYYENSHAVVFRLDGLLYRFLENPNDGYRSSLGSVDVVELTDLPLGSFVTFPPMTVTVRRFQGLRPDLDPQPWRDVQDDLLYALHEGHGMCVFVVGTKNIADYYPSFCATWTPEGDPHFEYLTKTEDPA
jgi:hypothetical protein